MRPLLVLILVLGAIGAFILAYRSGETTTPEEPLSGIDNPGVESVEPRAADGDLVAAPGDTRRVSSQAQDGDPRENVPDERGTLGTTLVGSVVDDDGQPVAEAEVTLTRYGVSAFEFFEPTPSEERIDDLVETTDADGRYAFASVEPYEGYSLVVKHAAYSPVEVGRVNVIEGEANEHPPIVLEGGLRLYGRITDSGGNDVPAAKLYLSPTALGLSAEPSKKADVRETSDSGEYSFDNVANGNFALTVIADGYGKVTIQQLNITGSDPIERDVVLEVAHQIGGQIRSTSGDIVEGAKVTAYSMTNKAQTTRSAASSGEDGEFVIQDVPPGNYTLIVRADGFEVKRIQRVETGDMNVVADMIPLPKVSGQILDKLTGRPIRNFQVQLRQQVQGSDETAPYADGKRKFTDPEGRYVLDCPRAGEYLVEGIARGYAESFSQRFHVTDGELTGVNVLMTRGGKIVGRVVNANGKPVAGAKVTTHDDKWTDDPFTRSLGPYYPTHASTREVRTNKEGLFTVTGLTAATYQIDVRHKNHAGTVQRGIIVADGSESDVKDIVVTTGATVSGTVYGPSGKALSGSVVHLTMDALPNEYPRQYSTKTDANGKYEFNHVKGGSYHVYATRSARADGNPFQSSFDLKNSRRKISVSDGQSYRGENFNLGG